MSQPKDAHRLATRPKHKVQVSDQKRTQTKSEPPRLAFCVSKKVATANELTTASSSRILAACAPCAELNVTLSHARAPKITLILAFLCIPAVKAAPRQKSPLSRPCATCLRTLHSLLHARSLMLALALRRVSAPICLFLALCTHFLNQNRFSAKKRLLACHRVVWKYRRYLNPHSRPFTLASKHFTHEQVPHQNTSPFSHSRLLHANKSTVRHMLSHHAIFTNNSYLFTIARRDKNARILNFARLCVCNLA